MKINCVVLLLLLCSCLTGTYDHSELNFEQKEISEIIGTMTDLMVNDVTNPPLAARFFAYASLAGYEIVANHDSSRQSLSGKLNGFPKIDHSTGIRYSWKLATLLAMMETAGRLQPSGQELIDKQQRLLDSCRQLGIADEIIRGSLEYARHVSQQILEYARADRYNEISNYPRYTPLGTEGSWYPTPPGYFAPVEPYFNTLRSFSLDSASQFAPLVPDEYSTDKGSSFYQQLLEVYREGTSISREHQEIAAFWDCNPFALQERGHLMTGTKKISPGAHWMGITGIVAQDKKCSFAETMEIYTLVAITLTDGFIACWDEKYRSNRIRPETAIRKHIDPEWKPFLQTPPFPEYLSGHSTISTASAIVLTHYFGEGVAFRDTVEVRFGLEPREFTSFLQASEEAAISRLYGGIHFMDAIERGKDQGRQVANWLIQKVEVKHKPVQ